MESEFKRKYIKEVRIPTSVFITAGIEVPEILVYLAFLAHKLLGRGGGRH